MIQLVALVAVVALIFAIFAFMKAAAGGRSVVAAPKTHAGEIERVEGSVRVPLPALLVTPVAFLVDPTLGIVTMAVFAAMMFRNGQIRWDVSRRRTPVVSNAAFSEWKSSEEEKISRMREALDSAEAEFLAHLEKRREDEDRREFAAFRETVARN
jgi:hypothetical protein